jgi:hypothetical protein
MKYRFRSNEKAVITAQISEEEKGKEIRRGMIPAPYVPDYLARRIRNNLPYLNVYDFGRLANGSASGLLVKETLTSSTTTGSTPLSNLTAVNMVSSLNAQILAYSVATMASTFRNISASLSDYVISVGDFSNYVSGQGLLSLTSATTFTVTASTQEYFLNWETTSRSLKITASSSYGAAATSYTHDAPADLFLVPHMWRYQGRATMGTTGGIGNFPSDVTETYDMFKPLPRTTQNDATWDSIWTNRASSGSYSSGERDFLRTLILENSDSEIAQYTADGVGGSFPVTTSAGSFFPSFYDALPPGRNWGTADVAAPQVYLIGDGHGTGCLVGIIVKHAPGGDEYYYIWTNQLWSVATSFDIGANETGVVV